MSVRITLPTGQFRFNGVPVPNSYRLRHITCQEVPMIEKKVFTFIQETDTPSDDSVKLEFTSLWGIVHKNDYVELDIKVETLR